MGSFRLRLPQKQDKIAIFGVIAPRFLPYSAPKTVLSEHFLCGNLSDLFL
jgi:hypothetical protein